jgi:hypothetical protein
MAQAARITPMATVRGRLHPITIQRRRFRCLIQYQPQTPRRALTMSRLTGLNWKEGWMSS